MTTAFPREGELLDEKYRIGRTLHSGSMAVVICARHLMLDELVAIKFLGSEAAVQPSAVKRFVQEARAAARIKSDHVVRVFDVVVGTGLPYIVMEYLRGSTMADWLGRSGRLGPQEAVDVLLQVCEVLAEAHALGFVHRDLKPANLFVVHGPGGAESVKVLDFGIAKKPTKGGSDGMWDAASTETWAILGSPFYMSPEQMESAHEVDARADIWALGVILFELLSGSVPYEGRSLVEIYSKIVSNPPPSLSPSLSCPPDLEHVMRRCLSTRREERYGDIGALARDLAQFGTNWSVPSVERVLRGFEPPPEVDEDTASPSLTPRSTITHDSFARSNATLVSPGIERKRPSAVGARV
jgi:eukaryotic-like serine/threonine-protein kinase